MMEVTVAKRRRSWEWRVHDQNGTLIMHGRERSRPAARYQGYRSLFMLLAVGRRSGSRGRPSFAQPGNQPPRAGDLRTFSVQPARLHGIKPIAATSGAAPEKFEAAS